MRRSSRPPAKGISSADRHPFQCEGVFGGLDKYLDEPFMPDGRERPAMPPDRKIFDD
jgi:hypothetical protein